MCVLVLAEEEEKSKAVSASADVVGEGFSKDTASPSLKEEVVTDSKAGLSSEEKLKLLSLYGCESDEDEYPNFINLRVKLLFVVGSYAFNCP